MYLIPGITDENFETKSKTEVHYEIHDEGYSPIILDPFKNMYYANYQET